MAGETWRRTRTVPVVFAWTAIGSLVTAVIILAEIRAPTNWIAVVLGSLVLAGSATFAAIAYLPLAISVSNEGIRLRYLRRREIVMWEQVHRVHVVEGSAILETSHRRIDLGSLGGRQLRELVREARQRGRKVSKGAPGGYGEPPSVSLDGSFPPM